MLRINLFHLSLPPPSLNFPLAPNSPLRYFLPPRIGVGAARRSEKERGGGGGKSSNRRNLKAGHFMMTTKVVRPPLGRRERGWQGETELLPLLPNLFFSLSFSRASKKEGAREGMDEAGWITILPSTRRVLYGCCSQGTWIDCFHYAKKKEEKNSLPLSLHLSFLISIQFPPRRHPSPTLRIF